MADFTRTAINQNAKREYTTPIGALDEFTDVVSQFVSDMPANYNISVTQTSESYKTKIVYFDTAGDEAGSVTLQTASRTTYNSGIVYLLGTEAAETFAGTGASGSEDEEQTWAAKFSCTYTASSGEDTFTVTIGNKYMLVTGYSSDETITQIENWADSVNKLT